MARKCYTVCRPATSSLPALRLTELRALGAVCGARNLGPPLAQARRAIGPAPVRELRAKKTNATRGESRGRWIREALPGASDFWV